MSGTTDRSWQRGMSVAYDRGREDGARGSRYLDETRGEGFAACYWQCTRP